MSQRGNDFGSTLRRRSGTRPALYSGNCGGRMSAGRGTRKLEDDMAEDRDLTTRGQENNLRGTGNDLKGRVKDAAGGLTGDKSMQAEGKWDKVKGKVQNVVGDVQRKVGMRDPER
jgi:uncharacterized protein YjbJ (UPF0337 family)